MNIDFKKLAASPGYKSIRKEVLSLIDEKYTSRILRMKQSDDQTVPVTKCFNPSCCKEKDCNNQYAYDICRHFRWIIDRAKHYSYRLDIPIETILNKWEENRNYRYRNYYQDCNFRKIKPFEVKVFETAEDMKVYIMTHKYRCSCCKEITSNPVECNSGKRMANGKVCDWKTYGLFRADGIYVVDKESCVPTLIFMPIDDFIPEAQQ